MRAIGVGFVVVAATLAAAAVSAGAPHRSVSLSCPALGGYQAGQITDEGFNGPYHSFRCDFTPQADTTTAGGSIRIEYLPTDSTTETGSTGCGQGKTAHVEVSETYWAYSEWQGGLIYVTGADAAATAFLDQISTLAKPCEQGDTTPPTVQAITSYGNAGSKIKLRFRVSDDSGKAKLYVAVYAGGKTVWRNNSGSQRAARNSPYTFTYTPPRSLVGSYEFCVVAVDESGNKSKLSCAALDIRKP